MPRGCFIPSTWEGGCRETGVKAQGQEGGGQTLALGDSKGGLLHAEKTEGKNLVQGWLGGMARGDAGEEQGQTGPGAHGQEAWSG